MTTGRVVKATLRFDGGHRRGIDAAAYGFTLKDAEGNLLAHEAQVIGYTTHNVAEYPGDDRWLVASRRDWSYRSPGLG